MNLSIDESKEILKDLYFDNVSNLTAICIIALNDDTKRDGLILGYEQLSQGARVTYILSFSKNDLNRPYAENTRETVRKHSLKYLVDYGLVIKNNDDPNRVTNSGNSNYILEPSFRKLIGAYLKDKNEYTLLKNTFVESLDISRLTEIEDLKQRTQNIIISHVSLKKDLVLSPGTHNIIEKFLVEDYSQQLSSCTKVVYVGDTKTKGLYFNKELVANIGLEIDMHKKIPDVIMCDDQNKTLYLFEAVASSGPIDFLRKKELEELFSDWNKKYSIIFTTAFLDSTLFKSFSDKIASGTRVYLIDQKRELYYKDC